MKNCNGVQHTCGSINYATCIKAEVTPNSQSELNEDDCLDLGLTTQDQYEQLGQIQSEIDLSELGQDCLTYVQEEGKNIVKNVLLKYEEEICNLKSEIEILKTTDICNKSISDCSLDFGNLVLPCDVIPQTLAETLQLLLNQHITP